MPSITALIPCRDARFLRGTIESLKRQTVEVNRIIVVDDGAHFHPSILSGLDVEVLTNETNIGKAASVNKALRLIDSEFTLCVDADTTFAPDCVERLLDSLIGKVQVVTARVYPYGRDTWVSIARGDSYDAWFKYDALIVNGCTYIGRTSFLLEHPLSSKTMVEDEEFTKEIGWDSWALVRDAKCYTREPENGWKLLHQLVRWRYGRYQLTKHKFTDLNEAVVVFRLLVICMLSAFLAFLVIAGIYGLIPIGLVSLSFPVISLMIILDIKSRRDVHKRYLVKYEAVDLVATVIVASLTLIHRKPSW